jgi:hypothetical protein
VDDTGFTINAKIYDFLKYVALVILPAVAALIIGLGITLNWSSAPAVAGVLTLIDTFLGAILGKSSKNFQASYPQAKLMGDFIVKVDQDGNANGMKIEADKEFIPNEGDVIGFKVKRQQMLE